MTVWQSLDAEDAPVDPAIVLSTTIDAPEPQTGRAAITWYEQQRSGLGGELFENDLCVSIGRLRRAP